MAKSVKKDVAVTDKSPKATADQLAAKRADLLGYQKGLVAGELKNTSIIKATRKEIARIKTQLNGKEGDK